MFDQIVSTFRAEGRIVIVGASLAGLRAAEALREKGFNGSLTIIGDEPHEPYDRPPLSKQVLKGWVPADHTKLPRLRLNVTGRNQCRRTWGVLFEDGQGSETHNH